MLPCVFCFCILFFVFFFISVIICLHVVFFLLFGMNASLKKKKIIWLELFKSNQLLACFGFNGYYCQTKLKWDPYVNIIYPFPFNNPPQMYAFVLSPITWFGLVQWTKQLHVPGLSPIVWGLTSSTEWRRSIFMYFASFRHVWLNGKIPRLAKS